MSAGITFAHRDADTSLEQLLKRADEAMYVRKRARMATSEPVIEPVR